MKKIVALFIFFVAFLLNSRDAKAMQWEIFGELNEPRFFFQALPISDTTILVIGGYNSHAPIGKKRLRSCEIIDIKNNKVYPAAEMNDARAEFKALLTKDSNVVVFGGVDNNVVGLKSVEYYDRSQNQWIQLADMLEPRLQLAAEWLNDEEVIIVGGRANAITVGTYVTEIYNVKKQTSRKGPDFNMYACGGVLGKTSTGKIWAFGFRESGANSYRTNYVYELDGKNNKWDVVAKLKDPVQNVTIINDTKHRLIAINGSLKEVELTNSDQLFIENNNEFKCVIQTNVRRTWHTATILNESEFITIGGLNENLTDEKTTEIYNTNTGILSYGPELNEARTAPIAVSIYNKQVQKYQVYIIAGTSNEYSYSLRTIEVLKYDK